LDFRNANWNPPNPSLGFGNPNWNLAYPNLHPPNSSLRLPKGGFGSSNTHFDPDENIFRVVATNRESGALYQ
jgi:hypothetical protein